MASRLEDGFIGEEGLEFSSGNFGLGNHFYKASIGSRGSYLSVMDLTKNKNGLFYLRDNSYQPTFENLGIGVDRVRKSVHKFVYLFLIWKSLWGGSYGDVDADISQFETEPLRCGYWALRN